MQSIKAREKCCRCYLSFCEVDLFLESEHHIIFRAFLAWINSQVAGKIAVSRNTHAMILFLVLQFLTC